MTLPAFQTAARYYGPNDLRVEAVALQPPQPNAVTVAIAACGICGSDLHHVAGGPPGNAEDFIEPISGERGPCVLGHEFSGTVVALGTDVARLVAEKKCNLALGTRVVAEAMWYCGECVECMQGITNMCRNGQFHGFGRNGAFASYCNSRWNLLHVLPDSVSFEEGALVEVLATAWHAVAMADFKKGQTALVTGAGPVGAFIIRVLQYIGASYLAVSEPTPARSAAAKAAGATVFDPRTTEVSEACLAATDGTGVDAVFECSGVQAAMDDAFKSVRRRGTLVSVAFWEAVHPAKINPTLMLMREFNFTGALAYTNADFAHVIKLVAEKKINTEGLITAKIPLADINSKGFDVLRKDPGQHVKILVEPETASKL